MIIIIPSTSVLSARVPPFTFPSETKTKKNIFEVENHVFEKLKMIVLKKYFNHKT